MTKNQKTKKMTDEEIINRQAAEIAVLKQELAEARSKKLGKKAAAYAAFFEPLLRTGGYTQQELLKKAALETSFSISGASTFLSDCKNPKYNKMDKLVVVTNGKLSFE